MTNCYEDQEPPESNLPLMLAHHLLNTFWLCHLTRKYLQIDLKVQARPKSQVRIEDVVEKLPVSWTKLQLQLVLLIQECRKRLVLLLQVKYSKNQVPL